MREVMPMADGDKTLDQIAAEAKQDVGEAIESWVFEFERETSDLETFPTIDALEASLVELHGKTRNILLQLASDAISRIDDSEAVAAKKES